MSVVIRAFVAAWVCVVFSASAVGEAAVSRTIEGTLTDAAGQPVAGASVSTIEFGGRATSGSDGRFSLTLEVPKEVVAASLVAFASANGEALTGAASIAITTEKTIDAGTVRLDPSCPAQFAEGFGLPGLNGLAYAMVEFDEDGAGPNPPALFVGGEFISAGGQPANGIARWSGTSWSSLGTGSANGVSGLVYALTVFDEDGPGPTPAALFVGGSFATAGGQPANRVARWNGTSWSSLGTGSANGVSSAVRALTVFDEDGLGPSPAALFVGGGFGTAGGQPASGIARWNGSAWSSLGKGSGNGVNSGVRALAVLDEDGPGPSPAALFVGGRFTTAGGQPANRIARWNGSSWSSLGAGSSNGVNGISASASVYALTVFDEDGSGLSPAALFVGGEFHLAGGQPANRIARWNGTSWSSVGTGSANGVQGNWVYALTVFDQDGPGPIPAALAVGGFFQTAGERTAFNIARWDGTSWSSVGTGSANGVSSTVHALTVFDQDGPGPGSAALVVGGTFGTAGGQAANFIARWNGTSWSSLGTGSANGVSSAVRALTVFDEDGPGPAAPALFVGGSFTTAGLQPANRIASWNGTSWSSLGTGSANGVNGLVYALTVFDEDGPGPTPAALFVGGSFATAGGQFATGIARWNGTSWSSLGSVFGQGVAGSVYALTVFDEDGASPTLPALIVGGLFDGAGDQSENDLANNIARWNGSSWSSLGAGSSNGVGGIYASVYALTVFDEDGPGPTAPALVVGGDFTLAGGQAANRIARWNGTSWSSLGAGSSNGVVGGIYASVYALTVFDEDGPGPTPAALFVGGTFTTAGGQPANRIARWNGTSWSSIGAGSSNGVGGSSDPFVSALTVFDEDGPGPTPAALFVGGSFTTAGGQAANSIARWNAKSWSSLGTGTGVNGSVIALTLFDRDGTGTNPPALFVGGGFTTAGGILSNNIAKWFTPPCGPLTGACCAGVGCSVVAEAACTGANTRFVGPGSVCNAPGNNATPCCRSDFNQDGTRAPADIFAFLNAYFSTDPAAVALTDFDGGGTRQPADIFAFLNAYFAGGC